MKTSMVILFVLVSLSLVFSLFTVVILWENHIGFNSNPISPTTAPTITPEALLGYNESLREDLLNNQTMLVISFNFTLIQGSERTLNYCQFSVSPYVPRGGIDPTGGILTMAYSKAFSQERGIVTVDNNNPAQIFQLTFYFPTFGKNFDDNIGHYTDYEIKFNEVILFSGQTNQTQI